MNASSPLRGWRSLGVVIVVLALAVLACGGTVEPTATPLPRPTQKPVATNTKTAPDPTAKPKASATPAGQSSVFDVEPYDHPSGAFSLNLPSGWKQEEYDSRVLVTSPDAVVAIDITFYNVGEAFSADELGNFIHAVEDNYFGGYPNYDGGNLDTFDDGSVGVFKTLDLNNGIPQTVQSYYWQDGDVIFETDFWVDSDQYDDYSDSLIALLGSMTTNSTEGAKQDVYSTIYTFTGPNNAVQFSAPFGWTYATDTPENMVVDTWTAPDHQTFIENVAFDDGTPVDDLSAFAHQLLTEYYGLDDLDVTNEEPQQDGSLGLSWKSDSSGIVGESFIQPGDSGTLVLMITWEVTADAKDLYQPVWDYLLSTYVVPAPEE